MHPRDAALFVITFIIVFYTLNKSPAINQADMFDHCLRKTKIDSTDTHHCDDYMTKLIARYPIDMIYEGLCYDSRNHPFIAYESSWHARWCKYLTGRSNF